MCTGSIKSDVQLIHDVEGNRPEIAHVWERNLGGHVFNDEDNGRFLQQYCQTDCGDDGVEGLQWVMEVGLCGRGSGGGRYVADQVVHVEVLGNHCGVRRGLVYL